MFGYGIGPILHNLNSQIEGSGGYELLGQRHYDKFSNELDSFFTGGDTERIVYQQTGKVWLCYKALYFLLLLLRCSLSIWCLMRPTPLNLEHWLGSLAMATLIPGILLTYTVCSQITAGPLMTPNRFQKASKKLRRFALLDAVALFLVGCMILFYALFNSAAAALDLLCGFALLGSSVCSFSLWLLEKRRKCTIIEP